MAEQAPNNETAARYTEHRNRTDEMRTDAEIVERVREIEKHDWLGTERSDLVAVLPFEQAREFLKDSIKESGWKQLARDEGAVKDRMHDYMPFAWKKANGRRGISAGRSLDHMSAWLWLLGREAAAEQVREYDQYGKPRLRAICEAFGWDWKQWDDGRWTSVDTENGQPPPAEVEALQ